MPDVISTFFPDGNINTINPMASLGVETTEANRRALGLKLFAGEIMSVFYDMAATEGKVRSVTIGDGISAQFPHTGIVKGGFHKPGTALAINTTKQAERTITIDDILYAAMFFPLQYDLVGHLQFRQEYARSAAQVLAETKDTIVFKDKSYVFKPEYRANEIAAIFLNGQMSYPTSVYLDEKSDPIGPVAGYMTEKQLLPVLKYFAEDLYKTTKWDDYVRENIK